MNLKDIEIGKLYKLVRKGSSWGVIGFAKAKSVEVVYINHSNGTIKIKQEGLDFSQTCNSYNLEEIVAYPEAKAKTFEVTVHNAQGSATYMTEQQDITQAYFRGNEPMIRFVTLDEMIVTLPNNVVITQKELK